MIDLITEKYLLSLQGWCPLEKMNKLNELVFKCKEEFPDTTLLSIELGVFAGRSLFPLALAHKELNNGFAVGIDTWDNKAPLEGTNSDENSKWWASVNIKDVFNEFVKAKLYAGWNGFVEHIVSRTDEAVRYVIDNSVTLLHQDSNHASEVIIKELELWSPKMKIGGYWVVDDTDWESTKEGYSKLPDLGFELVEQYPTWAIYKKVK